MTQMVDRHPEGRDSDKGSEEAVRAKTVEQLLEEQNMLLRQLVYGFSLLLGVALAEE